MPKGKEIKTGDRGYAVLIAYYSRITWIVTYLLAYLPTL